MDIVQFGMPTLIEHRNLEETVMLCKELGLEFIELNMNLPQYQIECLENTDEFLKIAKHFHIHDAAGSRNHLTLGSDEINSKLENTYDE